MKTHVLLMTLLAMLSLSSLCSGSTTEIARIPEMAQKSETVSGSFSYPVVQRIRTVLTDLRSWIWRRGETQDNFIGRCFGVARKLKFIMPIIIFKLGIIVTTLAFLTIFALKSLGLLVLLVIMNATGFAAKLALAKGHAEDHHSQKATPQNVHFHVHPTKDGHYRVGHHSSGSGGYDGYPSSSSFWDRSELGLGMDSVGDNNELSLVERLKRLNVYDSYRR